MAGAHAAGPAARVRRLLPYWLGAWAIQARAGLDARRTSPLASPSSLLLALTLLATWYGVYYLARSPQAQPVPFAFGGEAHPTDYARAMADGGLLALIACLGLAQLSHETTPALAQVAFTALSFYGMAALHLSAHPAPSLGLHGGPGRAGAQRRPGHGAAVRRAAALLISLDRP